MTREERLELLKMIEKDIYVCSLESTFLEDSKSCAIHSVIEELEQAPCEDCISRAEAIKAMDDLEKEDVEAYGCSIPECFDGERARKAICLLPSVQPKAKVG